METEEVVISRASMKQKIVEEEDRSGSRRVSDPGTTSHLQVPGNFLSASSIRCHLLWRTLLLVSHLLFRLCRRLSCLLFRLCRRLSFLLFRL